MENYRFVLTGLMIILSHPGAPADDRVDHIEGAFGLCLGDKFEPDPRMSEEGDIYRFTPAIPNPLFAKYTVSITPNTHRICEIVAESKKIESEDQAKKMVDDLERYLHLKYGPGDQANYNFSKLGDRSVAAYGPFDIGNSTFRVEYIDLVLQKRAALEYNSNWAKTFNGAGL